MRYENHKESHINAYLIKTANPVVHQDDESLYNGQRFI